MRDVANAAIAQAQRPTIDEIGQADEAGRLALRGRGSPPRSCRRWAALPQKIVVVVLR
jgi:hypothetical protein